jgi:hypothetical protein
LSALVHRQALDDQLVTQIIERLVIDPEFLAQPPIADRLLQVQQPVTKVRVLEKVIKVPPMRSYEA